jgi:hypothetical protein
MSCWWRSVLCSLTNWMGVNEEMLPGEVVLLGSGYVAGSVSSSQSKTLCDREEQAIVPAADSSGAMGKIHFLDIGIVTIDVNESGARGVRNGCAGDAGGAKKIAGESATLERNFDGLDGRNAESCSAEEDALFVLECLNQARINGRAEEREIGNVIVSGGAKVGFASADEVAVAFAFPGHGGDAIGGGCPLAEPVLGSAGISYAGYSRDALAGVSAAVEREGHGSKTKGFPQGIAAKNGHVRKSSVRGAEFLQGAARNFPGR